MNAGCQSSQPLSRERCVFLTLRAWLDTVAPLTIGELNAKVQSLGRPAKNLIAKSGGILEFLKQCPELMVSNDRVEISLDSTSAHIGKLDSREVSTRLNQLSTNEINTLNRTLTRLHIGPRSSLLVAALQKRDQLNELERQCELKRAEIDNLKDRIDSKYPEDSHDVSVRLNELESVRDAASRRLSAKEAVIEEKVRTEKLLLKLDREIESREDKLGRVKLKILYNQEKLAMFEQDLFFESRQHESLTHELLEQHSSDSKKLARVFEVLIREKCAHSRAVLGAHIQALEAMKRGENGASRSCRRKMTEIEKQEEELLGRIRENRINLQMISQLELITVDSINSPLFVEKVAEVLSAEKESPTAENAAENLKTGPVEKTDTPLCAICLTDLASKPRDTLDCSHDFHRLVFFRLIFFLRLSESGS